MKRTVTKRWLVLATLVSLAAGSPAQADWDTFWTGVKTDYKRNNVWPQPFVDADLDGVRQPFEIMKHNGRRMNYTIGNELFDTDSAALTLAGARRVQWIATNPHEPDRTIYVLRGRNEQETNQRMAAVQESLASVHSYGPTPRVVVTDIAPATSSGEWATSVTREWIRSLPKPKLPSNTATGNSGVTQ